MGLGDQLIGTGLAKGAAARGKKIAFGDGRKIMWDHNSEKIFWHNPNIARPEEIGRGDLEWVTFYKGSRIYNRQGDGRWLWNYDFRVKPGEMYFSELELMRGAQHGRGFIVIEPNVESWKPMAPNKQWGVDKWKALAERLRPDFDLVQFKYPKAGAPLPGVRIVETPDFRSAMATMRQATLYVGCEGGLHHGAAALRRRAVVIFGGFAPPEVTGYQDHINLASGGPACGSFKPCEHCRRAMDEIPIELVYDSVVGQMSAAAA